ncbi:MAG: CHASE2 domain-containing protein [Pseudobdellovibrio sp.]
MDFNKPQLSFKSIVFRSFLAIAAAILISSLNVDFLESQLYDARVKIKSYFSPTPLTYTPIRLVYITGKTIERFQGDPTYTDHIKLLQVIKEQNPKFIIYQFQIENGEFLDIKGSVEEKNAFAQYTKNIPNLIIATQDLQMRGVTQKLALKEPLDHIELYSAPFSSDTKSFGADGVTRRLMFQYQDKSMLQPFVASYFNPEIQNLEKIRGQYYYLDSRQLYINYYRKGSFPTFSFDDVIDNKINNHEFENKIVIVGSNSEKSASDYVTTPFSRETIAMTKTELQAHQIQTLIDNNAQIKLPKSVNVVLTILISVLTVYVTLSLKPARGLVILGATLLGIGFLGTLFFVIFGLWFNLAYPFMTIFLCYYFFIPYRLIRENRTSWEYYQKNRLLSQVEELKTNFISMMSHDLKTPIARIQGMTEVIYKDAQPISSAQREALDTIRSSSDDLLRFINSILQYGRIESQGVELHKQNKDINTLLTDVIKKHEFLAKVKRIKINQELEPLFPVAVDPELIKQVFSNLLENAIKYSPEDSQIYVRSREENDKIYVEFKDHGIGIPAIDLPNIFMKFFRTHTVKSTAIKGSGLGLYLAQYFIKLHNGNITVTSTQGTGSNFTIELPSK